MGRKWTQEEKDRMREIMRAKYANSTAAAVSYSGESLRGYGHQIYQRDGFKCVYCGADGSKSFDTWLTLTCDHLLPKGYPERENEDFIVTACNFCNVAENRYFSKVEKLGLKFDGLTREQLISQRKPFVEEVRRKFKEFWEKEVFPLNE